VGPVRNASRVAVTSGQLEHEWRHMLGKLRARSPERYRRWRGLESPEAHPMFEVVAGPVEPWERQGDLARP
jgi:hypothetical protein